MRRGQVCYGATPRWWHHVHRPQVRAKGSITRGTEFQESQNTKCKGKDKTKEAIHDKGDWLEREAANKRKSTENREDRS